MRVSLDQSGDQAKEAQADSEPAKHRHQLPTQVCRWVDSRIDKEIVIPRRPIFNDIDPRIQIRVTDVKRQIVHEINDETAQERSIEYHASWLNRMSGIERLP